MNRSNMNILAIDYGTKRVGLAWQQTGLDLILPFGIIENKGEEKVLADIKKIISEEGINEIVLGLPIFVDGKDTDWTETVKNFGEKLKVLTGLPVHLVDERFSSRAADRLGADGASRDEKAAMLLLESYVSHRT